MIRVTTIGLITNDLKTHIMMYLNQYPEEAALVAATAAIEKVSIHGIVVWVSQGQKHHRFTYVEHIGRMIWIELVKVEKFAAHSVGAMPTWLKVWEKDSSAS